ncbi:type 1 glutamine amidotransferase [Sphingomonas sabuli]|uniref:type 1 glutamine amidotransferase n=1 Tax=Sphingomonas sabuli TaxID=2764186 RepID=UPI001CA3F2D5|nr:type 1 glutamine amidotransferase [Sphingomonas sabuli]
MAVLETGRPPGALAEEYGDYPDMFGRLVGDGFEMEKFDVTRGEFPETDVHAGYMITGSPAGVYDPLPWIAPLFEFIRAAERVPTVGICFGHQAMAQALGGDVIKSPKGWSSGLHTYRVVRQEPWMQSEGSVAIPASHQDQVVRQPPASDVVAESNFTPFAALAYRDRPAISFQFHPEFTPAYAKALIRARSDAFPEPDALLHSLDAPNDTDRVGRWIRSFFQETNS